MDFLDNVEASKQAEEERVRRETAEGVGRFREEQLRRERETAGSTLDEDGDEGNNGEGWAVGGGRKRKRRQDKVTVRGLKRRGSTAAGDEEGSRAGIAEAAGVRRRTSGGSEADEAGRGVAAKDVRIEPSPQAPSVPKIGLVEYGSDEEDDD